MPSPKKKTVLAEHGLEYESLVRVCLLNKKIVDAKELHGQLAHVVGGTEDAVTLSFIGFLTSEQRGFVRYTLPWSIVVLSHIGLVGMVEHARTWLAYDEDPSGAIDLSQVGEEENGSLFEIASESMSSNELFSLLLESCDHEGFGFPPDRADHIKWGWAESLRWTAHLEDMAIMLCRERLLRALYERLEASAEGSTALFIDRVNRSLDELKDESCERRQFGEWANGRIALIGMAWWSACFYEDLDMSDEKTRSTLLALLRHAVQIEHDMRQDALSAFWASVPPLPGLEAEHAKIVSDAFTKQFSAPDLTWQEIRKFLRGPASNLTALKSPGMPSEADLVDVMVSRWAVASDDQYLYALAHTDTTSFRAEDKPLARAKLAETLPLRTPHHLALALGSSVGIGIWGGFNAEMVAKIIERIRTRLTDPGYAAALKRHRRSMPLEIRALLDAPKV